MVYLIKQKIVISMNFQNTAFQWLTNWIFGHGLSKYTYPLAGIRLWGAIWTSALFNSQRKLTQSKFILRHCVCLSQMFMQPTMLSVPFTRNTCPSNRVFGNEDVPLHLGSSQLTTERMKRTNTANANITELPMKLKCGQFTTHKLSNYFAFTSVNLRIKIHYSYSKPS